MDFDIIVEKNMFFKFGKWQTYRNFSNVSLNLELEGFDFDIDHRCLQQIFRCQNVLEVVAQVINLFVAKTSSNMFQIDMFW